MGIVLGTRTKEHVVTFWTKVQDEEIQRMFPVTTESLEEALEMFNESLLEDAKSYGKVIYFDREYIGDVWCYGIDPGGKSAMLSVVIFAKVHWGKGIAAEAIRIFTSEMFHKYDIDRIGAFTFSSNHRSIGLLKKVGFFEIDSFVENGLESKYLELQREDLTVLGIS